MIPFASAPDGARAIAAATPAKRTFLFIAFSPSLLTCTSLSVVRPGRGGQGEDVGGGIPVAPDQTDLNQATAVRESASADGDGAVVPSGRRVRACCRFV